MKKPDWFILIEQWVPKRMGEHGVTLPFLVGALAYKAGQTKLGAQHVRDVLDDIIKHFVEGYITEVSWCWEMDAPVLNTKRIDSSERMRSSVALPRPSGDGDSLVFGPNIVSHWNSNDPSALIKRLAEDAAEPVSKGKYSRKRKDGGIEFEYGDFWPKDLDYIRSTIITSESGGRH